MSSKVGVAAAASFSGDKKKKDEIELRAESFSVCVKATETAVETGGSRADIKVSNLQFNNCVMEKNRSLCN